MPRTILVAGATGNVGRPLVAALTGAGHRVRALTRDPGRAALPAGAVPVGADLADPATVLPHLTGADAVFVAWPLRTGGALRTLLDAAFRRTRRVVLLGSGAAADLSMDEQERLAAPGTFLRPSTFAVNARWWALQIRAGDTVGGAYGSLAMPMLHERDIADVAALALTADGHAGRAYTLTGPRALSQAEQVRVLGDALGRPLRWVELPRAEAARQLRSDGLPPSFVDVLLDTYARMAAGPPAPVTSVVADILGRPARDFRRWADDHVADFT